MHIDHDGLVINTEADVEMKIITPLLRGAAYLDIPESCIKAKSYLAPTPFNKKAGQTSGTYPDFSIWFRSFPCLIVEAKAPDVTVETGYREAQLYAAYLNQNYPTGINPARFILSINGTRFMFGFWDSQPVLQGDISDLRPQSGLMAELKALAGPRPLDNHALQCLKASRAKTSIFPYNLAGGPALLRATITPNRFAAPLAPLLQRYFSSSHESSIREIVDRAYVSSDEVTEYDKILESLLKERTAGRRGDTVEYLQPERSGEQKLERTIAELAKPGKQHAHLQLIQGSVGSGKSLFMERYKQKLQPAEAKLKTKWATIDFIGAPVTLSGAEDWLCRKFIDSFQAENADVDFSSMSVLRGIYSRKIQMRKPLYAQLERVSPEQAEIRKAEDLMAWQDDLHDTARGLAEYVISTNRSLVVVMDNVDRLDLANQLAAFQLTLWFMQLTNAFVILQMRDETYERFKDKPPLDTYRSGVVFHISPPRFVDVVKRRLELSIEYLAEEKSEDRFYEIESGLRIRYTNEDLQVFLKRLYGALFDRRRNIARVLEALAGKDVRKALAIFVAIITSGYLSTTAIASNTLGAGSISLKEQTILRILMRTNRRFFSRDSGFIQNIFAYDDDCVKPDNFIAIEVLFFLFKHRKTIGPINIEGYFTCSQIVDEMQKLGYVPDDVFLVLKQMARSDLIVTDRMNSIDIEWDDSVRILASGWVHLRLLTEEFEYLFGVIPSTPIRDQRTAEYLAELAKLESERGELDFFQKYRAVDTFYRYLWHERERNKTPFTDGPESGAEYVLGHIRSTLERTKYSSKKTGVEDDLLDL